MADIFLSYAREDLELAKMLAQLFEHERWTVFWDRRIPPGRAFADYIEEQLLTARAVIVLWSPHSIASKWVRNEAAHGLDRENPALIPILIAPLTPAAAIPFEFRHLHAADLSVWPPDPRGIEFREVLNAIEALAPRARRQQESDSYNRIQADPSSSSAASRPADDSPGGSRSGDSGRVDLPADATVRGGPYITDGKRKSRLGDIVSAFRTSRWLRWVGASGIAIVAVSTAVHFYRINNPSLPAIDVRVDAGPFVMGSDKRRDASADDDEVWGEGGMVRLEAFFIGRYEVTVAQYGDCVYAKACTSVYERHIAGHESNWPVMNVTWREALKYCEWLDRTLKASADASADFNYALGDRWRVTLPSEAEWEKSARGTDGRIYPWGNDIGPDTTNYEPYRLTWIAPVGSFGGDRSPYGALDMAGNVSEWTRSKKAPYPYQASDGREDLAGDAPRVVRGGSFESSSKGVRAASRWELPVDYYGWGTGFRVVVTRF